MPWLPYLRFAKLLAVLVFSSGVVGTVVARDLATRRRFAFWLAGPGFGATWITGFVLAGVLGISFFSLFIVGSLVASLVSLQACLYLAGREGRGGPLSHALAVVPLVFTLWLMVLRPA